MAAAGADPVGIDTAYRGDPAHYARTRAFPPGIAEQIIHALLTRLGRPTRALDVGAGTGRVAVPLARAGVRTLALDLSPKMCRFLAARAQAEPIPLTVLQGDARRLPLATGQVDAVLTVHMLHLLPDPRAALVEMRRVLRAGGWLAVGLQEHAADAPVAWAQRLWAQALQRAGLTLPLAGWRTYDDLEGHLRGLGGRLQTRLVAARWQVPVRPAEVWDGVRERRYSPYWGLSRIQHAALSRRLGRVFQRRFGPGRRPRAERRAFVWYVYRFDAARP